MKDEGRWKCRTLISSQNWLGLRISTGDKTSEVSELPKLNGVCDPQPLSCLSQQCKWTT